MAYPELEDTRVDRAIHTEYLDKKSEKTGAPIGSYFYVMYEGNYQDMNFKYDPSQSAEKNKEELLSEILDNYVEPVQAIECEDIESKTKAPGAKPYHLVLF